MESQYVWALVVAALLLLFFFCHRSYRQTLLLKATGKHPTPEKLADGKFYYLVEESDYNRLKMLEQQIQQQEPIGYISTDTVHVLRQPHPWRGPGDHHIRHCHAPRGHRSLVPVYLEIKR